MAVPYDSYDYPGYWVGRKYEDLAERMALKKLFSAIPEKRTLIDIGGGFGRLTDFYAKEFKKCLLVDSSEKLLKLAKTKLKKYKNIEFKRGRAQELPVGENQFDAALIIRVSHHLPKLEKALQEANRVLKPEGFLILEFANKIHFKSVIKAIFKGRLGYLLSHVPENISTRKGVLFLNYHPSHVKSLLLANRFQVVKALPVSNFRHPILKRLIPLRILLFLESLFSVLGSRFSLFLGPSIFILAQKTNSLLT